MDELWFVTVVVGAIAAIAGYMLENRRDDRDRAEMRDHRAELRSVHDRLGAIEAKHEALQAEHDALVARFHAWLDSE